MRVLVVNAHSTLNRGDAAILDGLIATLRACGADHVVVAAPRAPGEVERRLALGADETVPMVVDPLTAPAWMRATYPTLAIWVVSSIASAVLTALVAPRSRGAIRAYRDADLVVSSGGGYLGGSRLGSNVLTVFQIAFARLVGNRAILAPVTVKQMSPIVRWLLGVGLRGARVFARDLPTIARLAGLGIPATFASDLAFRSPSLARAGARPRPGHDGLVVGWAPRQFGPDHDAYRDRAAIEERTVAALGALVRDRGARVVVVPQSNVSGLEDDVIVIDRVVRRLPGDLRPSVETLAPADGIEEAVGQFARADVLLASRMHAAITALFAGTPSLVVGYESKVRGVFELLGLADWVIDPGAMPAGPELATRLAALATDAERGRIGPALEKARAGFGELDATLRLQSVTRSDAASPRDDGLLVGGRSRRLARAVLYRLPGSHHAAAIEQGLTVRRNSRRVGRAGIVTYPQAERLWYLPHPPDWTTEAIFADGTRMRVHLRGERFYRDLNGWLSFDLYRDAWQWLAPLGARDILDCASGSGYGAVLLREWGAATVLGVDIDQECIEYAQHRYQLAGVAFMAGDAERLEGVSDASVQAVVSIETIEHVRSGEACLAQFQRVLQPGGSLYLTTPDGTDRAHSGNPFHHKEYSARELLTLLRARFASVDVESVESQLIARCRSPLADVTRSESAH